MQVVKCAKDLPQCSMSEAIEKGLENALAKKYEEKAAELDVSLDEIDKVDDISIRVVSNMERQHLVRDEVSLTIYIHICPMQAVSSNLFVFLTLLLLSLFSRSFPASINRCSSGTRRRAAPPISPSARSASSCSRRFTASTSFCLACTSTSTAMIVLLPIVDASTSPTSTRSIISSLVASAQPFIIRSSSNTSVLSRSVASTPPTSGVARRRRATTTSFIATRKISSPPKTKCFASGTTTCSKRPKRRAL